jgi:subtilisin family serine protease
MAKKVSSGRSKSEDFSLEPQEDLLRDLDPHLQEVILAHRAGQELDPSLASATADGTVRVDVLAKLKDPSRSVPGLEITRKIGDVVTGVVEIDRLEEVRTHSNVVSLKGATRLHIDLEFSVPEIQCSATGLQTAFPGLQETLNGRGAIVGIVDTGCDFRHENFRDSSGATRLLFLWDQRGEATEISPAGFGFGREFTRADIDRALQEADPFQVLAYSPRASAHGTHVLDIAAGNGRRTGRPGVAPGSDIIFVEVAAGDFSDEESFGNSRRLLEAVDYIFTKARELGRAAVVNLSLGTHGGPHDGSTLVEQGFDRLLDEPGRAIVISAGNSFEARSHAQSTVRSDTPKILSWQVRSSDLTPNELEIWYSGGNRLEVTLISPSGTRLGPVQLGQTQDIRRSDGERLGRIIHRRGDPNNGDNQIDILMNNALPKGLWKIELTTAETQPVPFHAWIERDDFGQSVFALEDSVSSHTLGSISCGTRTLVVGSYDAHVPQRSLSGFSSAGPTRDGRQKPETSAPGDRVEAANALAGSIVKSGTSMAAPHVTGLIALLFQAAQRMMTINEIRQAVTAAARRNPPAGNGWDPRYGFGRIDGVATLRPLLTAAGAQAALAVPAGAIGAIPPTSIQERGQDAFSELLTNIVAQASKARVRVAIEVEPLIP